MSVTDLTLERRLLLETLEARPCVRLWGELSLLAFACTITQDLLHRAGFRPVWRQRKGPAMHRAATSQICEQPLQNE